MSALYVDAGKCRKDGICAAVCPVGIIRGGRGELPVLDENRVNRCLGCGQCMAFCPTHACAAPGFSIDEYRFLRKDLLPAPEQVAELIFSRRSIRNFRDEPVPRATLERIIDGCRWAPTGHNRQGYRWIILESRQEVSAFLDIVFTWLRDLPQTDSDMAETLHAQGVVKAWDQRGLNVITRGAPHIVITAGPDDELYQRVDGIIALTYFEILAQSLGVGCMWSGYFMRLFGHPAGTAAREFLGLGPGEAAYSGQIAGYPKFTAVSRPPRDPSRVTWK